jgi:uncharacterized protein
LTQGRLQANSAQIAHNFGKGLIDIMKLHLNSADGHNAITGHGAGYIAVNRVQIAQCVIVMPDRLINPWPGVGGVGGPRLADLTLEHFNTVFELDPELVVFGSGGSFRFPHPRIVAAFSQRRIGFEVMDTPAACRTYNVLMSEGRKVAAALLVEAAGPSHPIAPQQS